MSELLDLEAQMQAEADQSDFGVVLPRRAAHVAMTAVLAERARCAALIAGHAAPNDIGLHHLLSDIDEGRQP